MLTEQELPLILSEFYQCTQPQKIYLLNQTLTKFQLSPEAWQITWNLLQTSQDDIVLFFCGNTLAQKIKFKIRELDNEKQINLRDNLIAYLKNKASESNFSRLVLSSILACVVQLIIVLSPHFWPNPICQLLDQMQLDNDPDRSKEVLLVLNALEFLADTFSNLKELKSRLSSIRSTLEKDSQRVIDYCNNVMLYNWPRPEIYNACLSCASTWIVALNVDFISLEGFMTRAFDAAFEPQLSDKAVDFLSAVFEHLSDSNHSEENSTTRMGNFDNDKDNQRILYFRRLTAMLPALHKAASIQDSDKIHLYTKLFIGVIESQPTTLLRPLLLCPQTLQNMQDSSLLSQQEALSLLEAMIVCVKAGGLQYPTEETSSILAVNSWYSITEAYEELIEKSSGLSSNCGKIFDQFFTQFIVAIVPKITIPEDFESTMDSDSMDNFFSYRADVMDVVNAMHVMETETGGVLKILVEELARQMNIVLDNNSPPKDIQAALRIVEVIIHIVSDGLFADFFELYESSTFKESGDSADDRYSDFDFESDFSPVVQTCNDLSVVSPITNKTSNTNYQNSSTNSISFSQASCDKLSSPNREHSLNQSIGFSQVHQQLSKFFELLLSLPMQYLLTNAHLAEGVHLAYSDYAFFLHREPTHYRAVIKLVVWMLQQSTGMELSPQSNSNSSQSLTNGSILKPPTALQIRLFAIKICVSLIKEYTWPRSILVSDWLLPHLTQQFKSLFITLYRAAGSTPQNSSFNNNDNFNNNNENNMNSNDCLDVFSFPINCASEDRQFVHELCSALGYFVARVGNEPSVEQLFNSVLQELLKIAECTFNNSRLNSNNNNNNNNSNINNNDNNSNVVPNNNPSNLKFSSPLNLNSLNSTTSNSFGSNISNNSSNNSKANSNLGLLAAILDAMKSLMNCCVGVRNSEEIQKKVWISNACKKIWLHWMRFFQMLLISSPSDMVGLHQIQLVHDFFSNITQIHLRLYPIMPEIYTEICRLLITALPDMWSNLFYLDFVTRLVMSFDGTVNGLVVRSKYNRRVRSLPDPIFRLCSYLLEILSQRYFPRNDYQSASSQSFLAGLHTACVHSLLVTRSLANFPLEQANMMFRFALFSLSFNLPDSTDSSFVDGCTLVHSIADQLLDKSSEEAESGPIVSDRNYSAASGTSSDSKLKEPTSEQQQYAKFVCVLLSRNWVLLNAMILLGASISGRQGIASLRIGKSLCTLYKLDPRRQTDTLRWMFSDLKTDSLIESGLHVDNQAIEVQRLFMQLDPGCLPIILNGFLSKQKEDISCALDTLTNAYHTWFLATLAPVMNNV